MDIDSMDREKLIAVLIVAQKMAEAKAKWDAYYDAWRAEHGPNATFTPNDCRNSPSFCQHDDEMRDAAKALFAQGAA